MTLTGWHDVLVAGGAMLLVAAVLAVVGSALICAGFSRLVARKIPHALCGIFVAVAAFQITSLAVAIGVLIVTAAALAVGVERRLVPDILDGTRGRDYGLVGFAVGVLGAAVVFWPDRPAIAAGVLVLGLADAGAALVGNRFGRHPVAVGQAVRTLEGSAAFVAIASAISLVFMLVGFGSSVQMAVAVSAFVGLTTSAIELLVLPAADNLLITPWVALLLHVGHNLQSGEAFRWLAAAIVAFGAVPLTVRLRWLDLPGAIGAALVTAVAIGLGGWVWIVPVATFFILTSLLTAYRRAKRITSMRGLNQVVVNGMLPVMVPVIGYALTAHQAWFFVYIGGIAASTADSWASEIGRLSTKSPVSLRTRHRVPGGTSGAVSALGFVATWLGGLTIGVVGAIIGNPAMIVVGMAAGVAGSLLDSALGATVQGRFLCPACHAALEDRRHCGVQGELSSGYRWIDNDVVNAFANAMGMAVALAVFGLVSL